MFDKNQLVKTKWQSGNINRYKNMGYNYTGLGTDLFVVAKDLSPNSKCEINVVCDYCNIEYKTKYCILNTGTTNACEKCAPLKANELRRERMASKKIKEAKDRCEIMGYTLLTSEEEYNGCKSDIKFLCPIHGEQTMMFDNFIRGHNCFECSYLNRAKKKTINEIIELVEKENGNRLLNPEEYKDIFCNNMRIRCACGQEYVVSIQNYRNRHQTRCATCSQKESVAEKRIREYLINNGIEFEQEKRFKDCRDSKPLPFDFYLPHFNTCIEFDGQHHFEPVYSIQHFEMTKRHDIIKNEYCKKMGIKLIRIPYYDGNDIENIINNQVEDIV